MRQLIAPQTDSPTPGAELTAPAQHIKCLSPSFASFESASSFHFALDTIRPDFLGSKLPSSLLLYSTSLPLLFLAPIYPSEVSPSQPCWTPSRLSPPPAW